MWSYQTGSCRHSDLYRLRHWSPGRLRLSMMIVGTRSWRSRAPRPMPAWPPPMITTYGCSVMPSSDASCSRSSSQVVRAGFARRSTPFGRVGPRRSSWPLSSSSVVSNVQHRPSRSRRCPRPRPAAVSKSIQASTTPPAPAGSSPSVIFQPRGCTQGSVWSSIALIAARPSSVLMFQVNATRSRQKQSSVNRAAAAAVSPADSASPKADSQVVTPAATS